MNEKSYNTLTREEKILFWKTHYSDFKKNNKSISEYCRDKKINKSTFTKWIKIIATDISNTGNLKLTQVLPKETDTETEKINYKTGIELQIRDIKIIIHNNANLDLLLSILKIIGI